MLNEKLQDESKISFRALQAEDLTQLYRWLNTPHVREWWGKKGISFEKVTEEYMPYILGTQPTKAFLILFAGFPIGYIQTYRVDDDPKYSKELQLGFEADGVDLFIGEKDYLHKGLGSILLRKFLREIVFVVTELETCIIDPEPTNTIAIRSYEKAGFRYLKTVQVTGEDAPSYLMVISRRDV